MTHLLRGAGGVNPHMGVELTEIGPDHIPSDESEGSYDPGESPAEAGWGITELAAREIELSFAGGCDAALMSVNACHWLGNIRDMRRLSLSSTAEHAAGRNTFVLVGTPEIGAAAKVVRGAFALDPSSRGVIVCRKEDEEAWRRQLESIARGELVMALGGSRSIGGAQGSDLHFNAEEAQVLAIGERLFHDTRGRLDRDQVGSLMDPLDLGIGTLPKRWKHAVSFSPYPELKIERWRGKGFPPHILSIIDEGVRIKPFDEPERQGARVGESIDPCSEKPLGPGRFADEFGRIHQFKVEAVQYAYPDREHFEQGVAECDRALLVGHLEPVPLHRVDEALAMAPAHPWSIVHQSADKWRAAQDYSCSTNARVGSKPFTLPSVWDAGEIVKENSHFAKYDLRDGFWAVKVAEVSRPYLMVRHPATGRLLWRKSLPFGYKLSPLVFCDFTEQVAQVFRARVAGMGIHIYVFVDDFLIVGSDRESTVRGMEMLEALFDELGLHWAIHKRRGPAQAIEFLGFLLINDPLTSGCALSITEGRQVRLQALIETWMMRRPDGRKAAKGGSAQAEPKELASLLGMLVFSAAAVPRGRTYMQGMLRQFAGLEVDWARGSVRYAGCSSAHGAR